MSDDTLASFVLNVFELTAKNTGLESLELDIQGISLLLGVSGQISEGGGWENEVAGTLTVLLGIAIASAVAPELFAGAAAAISDYILEKAGIEISESAIELVATAAARTGGRKYCSCRN